MNDTASQPPSILQVRDLHFAYPGEPAIVSGWTAAVGAGVTLLQGDTGSGKSTLLRVLAGALPAEGALTLAGVRLDADPAAYRRDVFFHDMAAEAFDASTGHECTAALRRGDARFDERRWRSLVDGFSLAPHLDKQMFMLSTGSRRKVGLAVALASGRALTLLDEPTAGLDAASTRCLRDALADVADEARRAVVVASGGGLEGVTLSGVVALPLG